MSHVPECEYVYGELDCDAPATHEVRAERPGQMLGGRVTYACEDHVRAVIGDNEVLVSAIALEDPCQNSPLGWTCSLRNGHIGPCPARPEIQLGERKLHSLSAPVTEAPVEPAEPAEAEPVPLVTVPVPAQYRPSKWSSPWILLLPLIGWELWTVATGKAGGPLSHLVWWAYGPRWGLRWWLLSMSMNALGLWAALHFMFEKWEVKELGFCVLIGLIIGMAGYIFTAVTR